MINMVLEWVNFVQFIYLRDKNDDFQFHIFIISTKYYSVLELEE